MSTQKTSREKKTNVLYISLALLVIGWFMLSSVPTGWSFIAFIPGIIFGALAWQANKDNAGEDASYHRPLAMIALLLNTFAASLAVWLLVTGTKFLGLAV